MIALGTANYSIFCINQGKQVFYQGKGSEGQVIFLNQEMICYVKNRQKSVLVYVSTKDIKCLICLIFGFQNLRFLPVF